MITPPSFLIGSSSFDNDFKPKWLVSKPNYDQFSRSNLLTMLNSFYSQKIINNQHIKPFLSTNETFVERLAW